MNAIAEIRNVTKTYGSIAALDSVTLSVESGDILGLLGSNGSGKTTLLRILASIDQPTKGEAYFRGVKVTNANIEKMRLESTMVFQRTVLFSSTVHSNVAYGLRIRRVQKDKINHEMKKALELVQLEGFEKRHAKKLSGGEQQRVALARALALKTPLLLLDEPTANIDPENAAIVEEAIAMANRELGTTVVMATHNMLQARKLPTHIALMENGRITQNGKAGNILNKLSKTLASFAAADNVFAGVAKITKEGTTSIDVGDALKLEAAGQHTGRVTAFVSPEDIILSRNRFASSARNTFKGKITQILETDSLVRLKVDIGKPFTVQITKRSFSDMGLNVDMEVFLAFKASSVQVA